RRSKSRPGSCRTPFTYTSQLSPTPVGRRTRDDSTSRRMPPPVRRKTLVLVLALGAALALAAVAYAGNGGFAPETPHSPNASRINDSYKWIAIFAALILAVVEGSLLLFVVRYRRRGRPRTAEGPQLHAHTRLELIW